MSKNKTFKDLKFHSKEWSNGSIAQLFFPNGYGVSVIYGEGAFGSSEAPYELAVMVGDEKKHSLSSDTPITGDVIGYRTVRQITNLMRRVQALVKE